MIYVFRNQQINMMQFSKRVSFFELSIRLTIEKINKHFDGCSKMFWRVPYNGSYKLIGKEWER